MNNKFEFSYSAPTEAERREIEHIKSQYQTDSKGSATLQKLRKLDGKVRNIPTCIALICGILGTLIFGFGLTLALEWELFVWGAIVGAFGCVVIGFAYVIYNILHNKLKDKYAPEIIKLSDELLKEINEK